MLGQKITDEEIKTMEELQKNMKKLIDGEYVGLEGKKLPFKMGDKDE